MKNNLFIMKTNHRPSSGVRSIKTAGTHIINNKVKDNMPNLMLVKDIQGTPGNGLWCINTDKVNKKSTSTNILTINPSDPKSNTNANNKQFTLTNPNLELELEFEKKKINQLKSQIEELTIKLNTAVTKCSDAEFRANRAENNKQTYMQLCEKKSAEIIELTEKIETLENSIINLNEALNNSRKEILRLQTEVQSEIEKSKKISEMYQNSVIEHERKHSLLITELNNLHAKFQHVNLEKENFIKMNRNYTQQEKSNENNNLQKLLEEKENLLRMTETQMRNYGNENTELKKKLNTEEILKTKLNEIIKKKKIKIEKLKEDLKSYKGAMETYTNEVKWNQELILQRDNQTKILKEKIKCFEEQNEKLKKENHKLKEIKSNTASKKEVFDQQEFRKITAKPYLFGPEKEDL